MRWRAEEAPLPFTGAAVREPQPAISDPLEALRVLVVLLVVLLAEAREGLEKEEEAAKSCSSYIVLTAETKHHV